MRSAINRSSVRSTLSARSPCSGQVPAAPRRGSAPWKPAPAVETAALPWALASRLLLKRAVSSSSFPLSWVRTGARCLMALRCSSPASSISSTRGNSRPRRAARMRKYASADRAVGVLAIEAACIDLGDVKEKPRMDAALLSQQPLQRLDELFICEPCDLWGLFMQCKHAIPPSLALLCSTGFFEPSGARVRHETHARDDARSRTRLHGRQRLSARAMRAHAPKQ